MPNKYTLPLTGEEQAQVLRELDRARLELERSRRKIQNLEKASRFLMTMNENAERVRDLNEQEILRNKQKAEDASQAKSTFLASMSHEMRTPMNAIKVLSELLLRSDLDKLQKDYANNIVNATASLLAIINDILDFSKLDAQMFEVVPAPYDVSSLLGDVTNIVNLRALDKNLDFFTDIDARIPSMLEGDDLRIKQILLNVLQNAVKYTAEGSVKLSIRLGECPRTGYIELLCEVNDTGIGIRPESIGLLFEPFSQADLMGNRQIEGTGLGLSITKGLLELMDGDIQVESEYGMGSCFSLRIPQKVLDDTPIAQLSRPESKRVLVAAGKTHAKASAEMVHSLGAHCDTASSPAELAGLLEQANYTHIIYYYDLFHSALAGLEESLGDARLIAIKDIRFAGRQQTRPSVGVLFEPILIHELGRVIESSDSGHSGNTYSDAGEIGRFAVRDTHALVVDDNEVNLMVLSQLLSQYNMECTLARNGIEALDLARDRKFDLIFMDHMMPIMNGVETTRKLRADQGPNTATPIIIVTANAIVGMREEFLREGLDDYISKPIDIKELNAIILKWLDQDKIVGEDTAAEEGTDSAYAFFMQGMQGLGLGSAELCRSMGYTPQTYLAITDTFIASVPATLDRLAAAYREADYDAFRIHVHGAKGALANIGAKRLSKHAAQLEKAASLADAAAIAEAFPVFSDELDALVNGIRALRPRQARGGGADPERPPRDSLAAEAVLAALDSAVEALDTLDSIQALETLGELDARLGDGQEELARVLEQVCGAIENFDYESATDHIRRLAQGVADDAQ